MERLDPFIKEADRKAVWEILDDLGDVPRRAYRAKKCFSTFIYTDPDWPKLRLGIKNMSEDEWVKNAWDKDWISEDKKTQYRMLASEMTSNIRCRAEKLDSTSSRSRPVTKNQRKNHLVSVLKKLRSTVSNKKIPKGYADELATKSIEELEKMYELQSTAVLGIENVKPVPHSPQLTVPLVASKRALGGSMGGSTKKRQRTLFKVPTVGKKSEKDWKKTYGHFSDDEEEEGEIKINK